MSSSGRWPARRCSPATLRGSHRRAGGHALPLKWFDLPLVVTPYLHLQFFGSELGEWPLVNRTIHHGRHTFISHALAGGRTLAEVRDAAGHSNVTITSGYLHVAVEEDGVGALFAWS